ncbi:MAG: nitrilase family protein [Bacteroidetes bacterium]|nr:nitrilase family protein [Bacteroidota bacterium]
MINEHKNELFVVTVQPDIVWENIEQNIKNYSILIDEICEVHPIIDLIILPEMFTTGFTVNPFEIAENMDGITINWMKEIAIQNKLAICGSLIITENSKYYNRFIFVKPDGSVDFYDKRHLFSYAGEHQSFSNGVKKVLINYKGWKINPYICYDLRFPVWCRNTDDVELMIFVANWPNKRISHWEKLLPARAIENQCFVIGVNRVGIDFNNLEYTGKSCIFDALGNEILNMQNREGFDFAILKKSEIVHIKTSMPFGKDNDTFEIL